jgi:putative ABC transport system permease protein
MKVRTADLPQTLAAIEATYRAHFPGNPFTYYFADAAFDEQYRADQRFATLFSAFAAIAIVIACLGLFGLASFTAQQRTKEIGVRKVLGASVYSLVALLSKDFLVLVGVAFLVAAPAAYFYMRGWLADFAYQITLGPGVFLLAGGLALIIALLTVSYQAVCTALTDPVKSLRYE